MRIALCNITCICQAHRLVDKARSVSFQMLDDHMNIPPSILSVLSLEATSKLLLR